MSKKIISLDPKPPVPGPGAGRSSPERWIRGAGAQATKRLTIDLEEDLHKRVRLLAATEGRTMADIVRELLEEACVARGQLP